MSIIGFNQKYLLISIALLLCLSLMVGCTASPVISPVTKEEPITYQIEINLLGTKYEAAVDSQGKIESSTQVTSADGEIGLSINKDTIIRDKDGKPIQLIQATIDPNPPSPPEDAEYMGTVYNLTPDGVTFDPSIKLILSYDPTKLPEGARADDIYIARYEDSKWEKLLYKQVDTESHRVATRIDHFARYAVAIPSAESTSIPTPNSNHTSVSLPTNRVEVVYFHRQKRCPGCIWAEEQTRYTLETYFKDELSSGKLMFASVNVQDDSNVVIIEKYGAYTSQLFINAIKGDTEHIEHIIEIWNLLGNEEAFHLLVKNKIAKALEEIG